jgi:hypothetical protein
VLRFLFPNIPLKLYDEFQILKGDRKTTGPFTERGDSSDEKGFDRQIHQLARGIVKHPDMCEAVKHHSGANHPGAHTMLQLLSEEVLAHGLAG